MERSRIGFLHAVVVLSFFVVLCFGTYVNAMWRPFNILWFPNKTTQSMLTIREVMVSVVMCQKFGCHDPQKQNLLSFGQQLQTQPQTKEYQGQCSPNIKSVFSAF